LIFVLEKWLKTDRKIPHAFFINNVKFSKKLTEKDKRKKKSKERRK